jgi:muramoyltetrapeptide carboxypeptidase
MPEPLKPPALLPGDRVRIVSLSSPVDEDRLQRGSEEISRLGYLPEVDREVVLAHQGFFAGSVATRCLALRQAFSESSTRAIFCSRGGYGANYLLRGLEMPSVEPKIFCGYSDLTALQSFLWKERGLVTFYGPMVAAGLDKGKDEPGGYDPWTLKQALTETKKGWTIDLQGVPLVDGMAEGTILGGCLTVILTTLGTPWELDTTNSILLLEDRAMKPWQVDRGLMHLLAAGKMASIKGIILGEFPECEPPPGTESVMDVALRVLGHLKIPVVVGAPIGHAIRPMLTLPLGVQARLTNSGETKLEILEPPCVP